MSDGNHLFPKLRSSFRWLWDRLGQPGANPSPELQVPVRHQVTGVQAHPKQH